LALSEREGDAMGRMERLSIELTPELSQSIEEAIASGEFASADEVVQSALATWQSSRLIYGYTVEELTALIDEGENSGEPIDGEEAFRQIAQELEDYIARKV
jgi:antitoxin ParD1/3/4